MYIHTFIWGGPVSIQAIQSEPGTYMDFGAWERIFFFFYGNENHWLEFKVLWMPSLHGEAFQKPQVAG